MSATKILTKNQLADFLLSLEGKRAYFVGLTTQTIGRATKKSRTTLESFESVFGCREVFKLNETVALINASYEKIVRARREAEGVEDKENPFKSKGTYGELLGKCLIRKPDGVMNVRTYGVKRATDKSFWVRPDGTILSDALVKRLKAEFLPAPKGSGRQGLSEDRKLNVIDYKMESIKSIKMEGVTYTVASF